MVRNWDTIRAILIALEEAKTPNASIRQDQVTGFDPQDVAYNMRLLEEAGFIEAIIRESKSGDDLINLAMAKRMTHAGHELLDTIRPQGAWEKIKAYAKEKGVGLTVTAVGEIGKALLSNTLKGS